MKHGAWRRALRGSKTSSLTISRLDTTRWLCAPPPPLRGQSAGEPAQTRHHALERGAPVAWRPAQHRERRNHDLQREREPHQRGGDILEENPKPVALAMEQTKSLSGFALTAP